MILATRKQFKSCGVNASCVLQQGSILKALVSMHHMFGNKEAFLKLCCRCIMFLATRKQFKSCGVNALSVGRQGNSSRILVSMHHVFVDREAF